MGGQRHLGETVVRGSRVAPLSRPWKVKGKANRLVQPEPPARVKARWPASLTPPASSLGRWLRCRTLYPVQGAGTREGPRARPPRTEILFSRCP
eukprot:scaffold2752_cov393-Prasinococcus_capsulatus_cf.AAC.19